MVLRYYLVEFIKKFDGINFNELKWQVYKSQIINSIIF